MLFIGNAALARASLVVAVTSLLLFGTRTASASASSVASPVRYNSYGCYSMSENRFGLNRESMPRAQAGASLSADSCAEFCLGTHGRTLFALMEAQHCWCGDPLLDWAWSPGDASFCKYTCPGNSTQMCGGRYLRDVSLYGVSASPPAVRPPPARFGYEQIGCFTSRGLSGGTPYKNNLIGPEYCANKCAAQGWSHFNLIEGNICGCGDDEPNFAQPVAPGECDMPCSGDDESICGGKGRGNAYRLRWPAGNRP